MIDQTKRLDSLINKALNSTNDLAGFSQTDAAWIIPIARNSIINDPTLIKIKAPVNICGDLHGMFTDLVKALKIGGLPPNTTWLFLGDYVDRGPQSAEILLLLFALKVRYPDNIFLLRGNHETNDMTSSYGFQEECYKKFINKKMWDHFIEVFDVLPLAAVIQDEFFCVHGGISPDLGKVSQIEKIQRPITIPKTGLVCDILWSDPDINVPFFEESERGNTLIWGLTAAKKFLSINKFKMIVRGHQVAPKGYDFPFGPDHDAVTIFTASSNSPSNIVKACFMSIKSDLTYSFVMLPFDAHSPSSNHTHAEAKRSETRKAKIQKTLNLSLKRNKGLTSSHITFQLQPRTPTAKASPLSLTHSNSSFSRCSSTSSLKMVRRPLF